VADFVEANGVDVLLVQEGVRSCFVYDTIRALADDLGFNYFAKSTFGFPLFWESRVGIISRYEITDVLSLDCEVPQTDWLDAIPLPWRKRAVAVAVEPPGLGNTWIVSAHLSSAPASQLARQLQVDALMAWVGDLPIAAITVLGGDFNLGRENPAFQTITRRGFIEAGASTPDFIFIQGAVQFAGQEVLTDREISDHAGVLVEVMP
jgi:endonuclease/exonuclease/phosphatase family metal-dependent hydrolase